MTVIVKGPLEELVSQAPEAEVQTDKPTGKIVSCTGCEKPLIVNTFYAPAIAKCTGCSGQVKTAGKGQAAIVQAGRTDPAKAANLEDCLINASFAKAICPAHPDDDEHAMELKSVHHNERYGPNELIGYTGGRPEFRQIATGEVVMHQCLKCKAVVTYSTAVQTQFRRCNEEGPRNIKSSEVWGNDLGAREGAIA